MTARTGEFVGKNKQREPMQKEQAQFTSQAESKVEAHSQTNIFKNNIQGYKPDQHVHTH